MSENGSLSQDEIDALLSMGDDSDTSTGADSTGGGGGGGMDELNLDSLLGGGDDSSSVGLDQESLNALAGAVGGGSSASSGGGIASPSSGSGDNKDNVDLLMDVSLRFTVELGRTTMYIKDVLLLGEGSIVELDKNVGDEVDILVNDRLFGRGKLIVMDEYFGVQVTHILDPLERYRNL